MAGITADTIVRAAVKENQSTNFQELTVWVRILKLANISALKLHILNVIGFKMYI